MLEHCNRIARFKETILFTVETVDRPGWRVVRIAAGMEATEYNRLANRRFPKYFTGQYAMSVHEDGFPTHPELWDPAFLDYDYIGAPWPDGVVGNDGFSIQSRRFFTDKMNLDLRKAPTGWQADDGTVFDFVPSDVLVCRVYRKELERLGNRFAPLDVAQRFSSERTGHDLATFGFHGRTANPTRYAAAWKELGPPGLEPGTKKL